MRGTGALSGMIISLEGGRQPYPRSGMSETVRGTDPADDDGPEFVLEEAEDAFLDGDRTAEVGTIRTALRHRDFRTLFLGMFASNIGSWMQNVIVAAMAYNITRSAWFVSLVGFANLGPQLLLAVVGGGLADTFDRRKLILWLNVEQLIGSLFLAWIALNPDPSRAAVPLRRRLHRHRRRPPVAGLPVAHPDPRAPQGPRRRGVAQLGEHERLAGHRPGDRRRPLRPRRPVVGVPRQRRHLRVDHGRRHEHHAPGRCRSPPATRASWSRLHRRLPLRAATSPWCAAASPRCSSSRSSAWASSPSCRCWPSVNLGVRPKSTTYGFLYATFGLGAVAGALSIGTFLAGRSLEKIVRVALLGFAACLTVYALLRSPAPAFPDRLRARLLLLRHRHVAGHGVPGPPRRLACGAGPARCG